MRLHQWPKTERPREKLLTAGCAALSDAELLAVCLRTGIAGTNAVDLARQLLSQFGSLRTLLSAPKSDICQVRGMGEAKFTQLQAAVEMARRYFDEPLNKGPVFDSAQTVKVYVHRQLRDELNEVFAVLFLDSQHQLITFEKLFFGTINSASVHTRVILQRVLAVNAAAVILTHNHPSGVAEPSQADKQITQRIHASLGLIDVSVLDHIVVGDASCVSFAERGIL